MPGFPETSVSIYSERNKNMEGKDDDPPPTPIAPLDEQPDGGDVMEYYAYSAADRLEYVKKQIEEREKAHFNLHLIQISLDGNPEPGTHRETEEKEAPCVCGKCELSRVTKLLTSMMYAINKLKAVHASLS